MIKIGPFYAALEPGSENVKKRDFEVEVSISKLNKTRWQRMLHDDNRYSDIPIQENRSENKYHHLPVLGRKTLQEIQKEVEERTSLSPFHSRRMRSEGKDNKAKNVTMKLLKFLGQPEPDRMQDSPMQHQHIGRSSVSPGFMRKTEPSLLETANFSHHADKENRRTQNITKQPASMNMFKSELRKVLGSSHHGDKPPLPNSQFRPKSSSLSMASLILKNKKISEGVAHYDELGHLEKNGLQKEIIFGLVKQLKREQSKRFRLESKLESHMNKDNSMIMFLVVF